MNKKKFYNKIVISLPQTRNTWIIKPNGWSRNGLPSHSSPLSATRSLYHSNDHDTIIKNRSSASLGLTCCSFEAEIKVSYRCESFGIFFSLSLCLLSLLFCWREVLSKTFSLRCIVCGNLITMQIRSTFIWCHEPWKHHHIVPLFVWFVIIFFSLGVFFSSFK